MIRKTKEKVQPKKDDKKTEPITKFRSGALQATVWSNEIEKDGQKFESFTFTIERSYKDDQDEWQHTNSYRKRDIANIQALMHRIADFLLIDEDEESEE